MALNIDKELDKTKQLIKALRICGNVYLDEGDCIECPYYIYYTSGCIDQLKNDAAEQLEFFLKLQDPMGLGKEVSNDNT